jgi:hypothetical protein
MRPFVALRQTTEHCCRRAAHGTNSTDPNSECAQEADTPKLDDRNRMNRFRPKPAMTHVAIAVALIGAAFTLGLAIWESQKGKTQAPAIISNQPVSQGQR